MKHLNNDLKPLAESDYPDRGPLLFGEGFAGRAKAAADGIKALKGAQSNKIFFGSGGITSPRSPQSVVQPKFPQASIQASWPTKTEQLQKVPNKAPKQPNN